MGIADGTRFILATMLFCGIVIFVMIRSARSGKQFTIRRIAGLDAIEEAVGRATEMGRPIHYTPGFGDVNTDVAPQTFAGLSMLTYVTELTAKYDANLIVTVRAPNVFPMAQEIVRQAYLAAGKVDKFHEDTVRFLSDAQLAWAAGVMGIMFREKVAANIMLGFFFAESLLFSEAGAQVGAIQVAGTANMAQIPFFVAACDYTLIGEELYAGGAYLSRDPIRVGSLVGQDYVKLVTLGFIVVGAFLATANNPWLTNLMRK